jgi:hypothetical protein
MPVWTCAWAEGHDAENPERVETMSDEPPEGWIQDLGPEGPRILCPKHAEEVREFRRQYEEDLRGDDPR